MSSPWPCIQLVISCIFATFVVAQPPQQTFFPASIPLAIRSPYMSIWYNSANTSGPLSSTWPSFWGTQYLMDLQGSVRVDGLTYIWTGEDNPNLGGLAANVSSARITPTRTIFVMQAGPMNLTITYLSPIEPSDWAIQSFPFSYVTFEATSLDGHPHAVEVYSELTGEWLSNDWQDSPIRWDQYSDQNMVMHIQLQNPEKFVEVNQGSQDGEAYFAMASRSGLTWQIDGNSNPRRQFHNQGVLTNTSSTAFGPIAPDIVIFGIAVDLGQIQSTESPLTWAFGQVRNPSIGYTSPDGTTQDLSPYYVTKYPGSSIDQAIDDFTATSSDTQQRAVKLDDAILGNASLISAQYADLVSLATRQTMGSLEITVSTGSDGKPNASDVRIFMKEIGCSTATGRVNPVEQMYAALPMFIYLNASLVGPLLAPLLDAQDGLAIQPYASPDIGLAYPNATGTQADRPEQGVEQTGNMLIMLYAHARFSGDGTLIHRHYDLAKRWADYLVNNSLSSSIQSAADLEISRAANMTNLALKGIIGVKAMAAMSRALGEEKDAQAYSDHATALTASWQSLAVSSDGGHLLGVYGDQQSWALMYDVYADRLLDTGVVSATLLQKQTAFYKTLLASSPKFGLPISSAAGSIVNAAWLLFTAATVTDVGVRDDLIRGVWNRASFNQTQGPTPVVYDSSTGALVGDQAVNTNAGPSFGAMFSLLALSVPNVTISLTPAQPGAGNATTTESGGQSGQGNSSGRHNISVGALAGGVSTGAALGVALVSAAVFYVRRRRRNRAVLGESIAVGDQPIAPLISPFMRDVNSPPGTYSPGVVQPSSPLPNADMSMESARLASPTSTKSGQQPFAGQSPRSPSLATRRLTDAHSGQPADDAPSSHNGSLSTTDVVGLRHEIESLRRAMQGLHNEVEAEAPPEYTG